ncbi:MAG: divergent polysaccharide deacetylase family protein [Candidatus Hydrogenedentes bacterium]|nr:divergent polysaccharide deacetylase family protein [Candidatus Hydrogenedentota bacterium]
MPRETTNAADQPAKHPLPNSWIVIGAGLAVCTAAAVLLVVVVNQHLKTRPINLREETLARAVEIEEMFRNNLIKPEQIRRAEPQLVQTDKASWYFTSFDVEAEGAEPDGVIAVLDREMAHGQVTVAAGETSEPVRQLDLSLGGCKFAEVRLHLPPPPPAPPIPENDPALINLLALAGLCDTVAQPLALGPHPPPRVAIILDDGGYGGPVTEAVLRLDPRLTLSILPGAPDAAETARKAAQAKFEVMLHLPMESPEDPGWISTSTTPEEMARRLDEALERVPGAVGVNNHMGSTFCTNEQALARFFDVVKTRPLFFIDSRTTHETVIPQAARQAGVPVAERKVFLDNDGDDGKIGEQFDRLIQFALENGTAIGIGHFRQTTVDALEKLLPELDKRGISLVHASQVVQ